MILIYNRQRKRFASVYEIKNYLDIKELSKLEQGAVQGGATEAKQKQKNRQKNDGDGTIGGPQQNMEYAV